MGVKQKRIAAMMRAPSESIDRSKSTCHPPKGEKAKGTKPIRKESGWEGAQPEGVRKDSGYHPEMKIVCLEIKDKEGNKRRQPDLSFIG